MAHFFIAIGGSGQNSALCYLRLARLCGFDPAPIWVIDADRTGEISQQFAAVKKPTEERGVSFVDPFPILGGNQKKFRDLIDGKPEAEKVFDVLFSTDQAEVQIRQGMYGRPSVGSTVIQYKIHKVVDAGEKDERLSELVEGLRVQGDHRVAITGSTFGGTGSGGVPALSEYISGMAKSEGFPATIFLGGVSFLPWFQLAQPPADVKRKGVGGIGNPEMIQNSQSSIAYLKGALKEHMNKHLLVGLPDNLPLRKWTGGTGQDEQVHFLGFLSAYLIHQEILQDGKKHKENVMQGYWIEEQGLLASTLNIKRPHPKDSQISESVSILQCIKETRAIIELIDLFVEFISPLPGYGFFPNLTEPKWLRDAIAKLSRHKSEKQTCEMIAKELSKEKEVLQRCLNWFLELGKKSGDAQGQRLFRFDEQETSFLGDKYNGCKANPMAFFRRWMRHMENTEILIDQSLPQELLKGLRLVIIDAFVE